MKQTLKLSLSVLSVGLVAGLAAFGWSVKAKDDATFHLANGVQVTPVEVKPDDALTLLDAKIWKFDVALPDRTKSYYYNLTAYKHGKAIGTVGGLESGPGPGQSYPSSSQLTVAMMPLGSGDFGEASQAKYSIHVYGAGTEGVFANPFKGCRSYTPETQVQIPESLITLIDGTETGLRYGDATLNDIYISLSIQPVAQPIAVKK